MAASRKNRLWGYTRYGAHEIKIYINPRMRQVDGETFRRKNGMVQIELNAELLHTPSLLDETILHELIHAIEYLTGAESFAQTEVDSCSAMVQTISKGLAQMLRELRQVTTED